MALPWLNPQKQQTGISMEIRKPDENSAKSEDQDGGLKACAQDLSDALAANNTSRIAAALRAAFQILDSEEESAPMPNEGQE